MDGWREQDTKTIQNVPVSSSQSETVPDPLILLMH